MNSGIKWRRLDVAYTRTFSGGSSSEPSSTLFNAFSANSLQKEQITAETHSLMFRQMIMGMTAFYVLLAVIVFIVPVYTDNFGSTVSKVSTAVLFMIGPISTVVQAMAVLGAAEQAAALATAAPAGLRRLAAVSCNPVTLARDLERLFAGGWRLGALRLYDQFLWTPHLELVALLER